MIQRKLFLFIYLFIFYELSSSDRDLFSKGLRLAIPPKQIDYSNFMTECELLYRSTLDLYITTEENDCFKTKLKDIALSTEEIISLKALMRNKDIIIQKADNTGNTVVITDKENYIEGVKRIISDSNKFVQLNITPDKYLNYIINVEKKFKQLFKDLLDNDKISTDEYDKICPKGSRPGILYGNPKIHKPVVNNLPKFLQFYLL